MIVRLDQNVLVLEDQFHLHVMMIAGVKNVVVGGPKVALVVRIVVLNVVRRKTSVVAHQAVNAVMTY
jgi:hypothetical protein